MIYGAIHAMYRRIRYMPTSMRTPTRTCMRIRICVENMVCRVSIQCTYGECSRGNVLDSLDENARHVTPFASSRNEETPV